MLTSFMPLLITDLHGFIREAWLSKKGKEQTWSHIQEYWDRTQYSWAVHALMKCTSKATTWNLSAFVMYSMVERHWLTLWGGLCRWAVSSISHRRMLVHTANILRCTRWRLCHFSVPLQHSKAWISFICWFGHSK